jgi:hypothetical protein
MRDVTWQNQLKYLKSLKKHELKRKFICFITYKFEIYFICEHQLFFFSLVTTPLVKILHLVFTQWKKKREYILFFSGSPIQLLADSPEKTGYVAYEYDKQNVYVSKAPGLSYTLINFTLLYLLTQATCNSYVIRAIILESLQVLVYLCQFCL